MQAEHSGLYPPVNEKSINAGDQVFVATPMPQQGGNIPMQTMGGQSQPMVVNSTPSSAPGQFLLNGVVVFRLGKIFCNNLLFF